MNLEIVKNIYIDVDYIIEGYELNANSTDAEIYDFVKDYTYSLDDCDYYAIGDEEMNKIVTEIRHRIGKQESLFDNA